MKMGHNELPHSVKTLCICSEERKTKFPFDIQHRSIITYKTESTRDFEELKKKITERILALLKKDAEITKTKMGVFT